MGHNSTACTAGTVDRAPVSANESTADPAAHHRYPVEIEMLVDRHALLGLSHDELIDAVPALRGIVRAPAFRRSGPLSAV